MNLERAFSQFPFDDSTQFELVMRQLDVLPTRTLPTTPQNINYHLDYHDMFS